MYPPEHSCTHGIANRDFIGRRDHKLPIAVRAGSNNAFEEIQKHYSNRLYKRILFITRNHEDAEDALQDTLLRAYLSLGSFQGRSHISTWLTRIAINSALTVIRRRRRACAEVSLTTQSESESDFQELDVCDSGPTPEESCDLTQRVNRVFNAIERLDLKSRIAIGIQIAQEPSLKEMAHTLDVSVAAAKARLYRARKELAKHLDYRGLKCYSQKQNESESTTQNRAATCVACD